MGISIMFFSSKGGVGKTTLTLDIAHRLGELSQAVAVIDADPQADASTSVGSKSTHTLEDILNHDVNVARATSPGAMPYDKLYAVAPGLTLEATGPVAFQKSGISCLEKVVKPLKEIFDFVLIDAAGKSDALNLAAIYQADYIFVVTDTGPTSVSAALSVLGTTEALKAKGWTGQISGVVATKVGGSRSQYHSEAETRISETFGDQLVARVPRSTRVECARGGRIIPTLLTCKNHEPIAKAMTGLTTLVRGLK